MGKSIRSKRKKRLRTLKREIVEPHYDAKDVSKEAAMEAALQAPKVEIITKKKASDMGTLSFFFPFPELRFFVIYVLVLCLFTFW